MASKHISAYIQDAKAWHERVRDSPTTDWMLDFEEAFDWGDMKTGPFTNWLTSDFSFSKPNGETVTGGAPAWAAVLEMYAPFSGHYHEPFFSISWETATGYELFGSAKLYTKFPVPGGLTKTDLNGRKWDVEVPGSFHFEFVKDPQGPKGLKMKSQKVYADGTPLVVELVKRGLATPEEALAKVS